jgi:hypothetical protein
VNASWTVLSLVFLSACTRTEGWKEDVLLSSGETLEVERRETHKPDAFFQPGLGPIGGTELVASIPPYGVVSYKVEGGDYPLLLDRIDGKLWVAFPVQGETSCEKYGNPLEPVVVMTYTGRKWTQVSLALAPADLRVNLDQTDRWFRPHDGTGQQLPRPHVTLEEKRALHTQGGPPSGMSIHDASALLRHFPHRCHAGGVAQRLER